MLATSVESFIIQMASEVNHLGQHFSSCEEGSVDNYQGRKCGKNKASMTKISALEPASEFSKWKSEAGAWLGKAILALMLPLTTMEGEGTIKIKIIEEENIFLYLPSFFHPV